MSSQPLQDEPVPPPEQKTGTLQPFEGIICPGIAFESGHIVWLFRFDETPTPLGGYSEVWIEAPDGDLTLYADPAEATAYVSTYHDFDRLERAIIDWGTLTEDELELTVKAGDGMTLELHAGLDRPVNTQVMETLSRLLPDAISRTAVGGAISTLTFNLLMRAEANGTKLLGRTETDTRYRAVAERLRTVDGAVATLNGTDLGRPVPSSSTRTYGDISTAREPYVVFGVLHMEYPAPGQLPS